MECLKHSNDVLRFLPQNTSSAAWQEARIRHENGWNPALQTGRKTPTKKCEV
jgi:hypothetical protein